MEFITVMFFVFIFSVFRSVIFDRPIILFSLIAMFAEYEGVFSSSFSGFITAIGLLVSQKLFKVNLEPPSTELCIKNNPSETPA